MSSLPVVPRGTVVVTLEIIDGMSDTSSLVRPKNKHE